MGHTPGPWDYSKRAIDGDYSIRGPVYRVALTAGDTDEDEANACLIAAAPRMYEALALIADNNTPEDTWARNVAQDTLVKAGLRWWRMNRR